MKEKKVYLSPEVEVVEVVNGSALCTTSGSTEDLQNGGVVDWFDK